jgi:hypothetical protein
MDKPSASDAHSPKATANNWVYGHHFPWEAEVQMAAPPRTDPIEHRATFDWLKRSANRNGARRGFG